jgi:hypothetical protein
MRGSPHADPLVRWIPLSPDVERRNMGFATGATYAVDTGQLESFGLLDRAPPTALPAYTWRTAR